jgi:hypothetical protein
MNMHELTRRDFEFLHDALCPCRKHTSHSQTAVISDSLFVEACSAMRSSCKPKHTFVEVMSLESRDSCNHQLRMSRGASGWVSAAAGGGAGGGQHGAAAAAASTPAAYI